MRIVLAVVGVLGSLSVHARAEPATVAGAAATSAPAAAEAAPARFGLAVNGPLGWAIGSSVDGEGTEDAN
ncbi:MAG TPA: hypothetical protein VK601_21435, partial [Kofleriaceae bacterium]|nr:hypothetical protein [Kofleriaceae bacterium]